METNVTNTKLEPSATIPNKEKKIRSTICQNPYTKILGYMILVFFPLLCVFVLEYFNFVEHEKFITFWQNHQNVVLFDSIVVSLGFWAILCAVKKGWVACLITGSLCITAALVNYYKFALVGEHFYPWDIYMAKNIGEVASFVSIVPQMKYFIIVAFVIGIIFVLWYIKTDIKLKWWARFPITISISLAIISIANSPVTSTKILNKFSMYFEDTALQDSNYKANGFTGAFLINIASSAVNAPKDYSKQYISSIMDKYEDTPAAKDFKSPDIVLILAESFWDPKLLPNTEFSQNPTSNFEKIVNDNKNAFGGKFYTTGFGGGTVRPEFEVLTGLTTDGLPSGSVPYQYVNHSIDTYISQYKSLGYDTLAIHPYDPNFYERRNSYDKIGFDHFYGEEDLAQIKEVTPVRKGGYVSDDTFVDYVKYFLEDADKPLFLSGITMENHQPYNDKYSGNTPTEIKVTNPAFTAEIQNAVENYAQGVLDTDRALKKLVDYIDSRQKPTMLVFYGDHLPTLGANYGAYDQSGYLDNPTSWTAEERLRLQSTPFMVYANYDIDSSVFASKTKTNVSSYNLLNVAGSAIGTPKTKYMDFLSAYYKTLPMYNIRLSMDITSQQSPFVLAHKALTYDILLGKKYSLDKK